MTCSSPDRASPPLRLIPTALSALLAIGCYDYTLPPRAIDSHDSIVDDSDSSLETDTGPDSTDTVEDSGSEPDTLVINGTDTETDSETQSDTESSSDSETDSATDPDSDTQPEPDPLPISGLRISSGDRHTCTVLQSGDVKCWGTNNDGQLGDNSWSSEDTPVLVEFPPLNPPAVTISCGANHSCALLDTGAVQCWGHDDCGQVGTGIGGHGTTCDQPDSEHRTPKDVAGLTSGVAQVAAGGSHTCAVLTTGALVCWGKDGSGQLGNDSATDNQATPQPVLGLSNGVTNVAAGLKHTCAIQNGALKCWGDNGYGQLGDGNDPVDRNTPSGVIGLDSGVRAVSAGDRHTCVLMSSEEVVCFGSNDFGQLGDDNGVLGAMESIPVPVTGLGISSGVSDIFAGPFHNCALLDTGELLCWGRNDDGQLGTGAYGIGADEHAPTTIYPGASGLRDVSGGTRFSCALFTDWHAECWGYEGLGELGDGPGCTILTHPLPVLVTGLP